MSRPTLHVKTPGVVNPAPTAEEVAAEEAALEAEIAAGDVEPQVPAAVASAPDDLKAYIDEQIAKGIAAGIRDIKRAQLGEAPKSQPLPDASEVDIDKITDMVLTKQGYVIPRNYGKVPAHIATQIQLGQSR